MEAENAARRLGRISRWKNENGVIFCSDYRSLERIFFITEIYEVRDKSNGRFLDFLSH